MGPTSPLIVIGLLGGAAGLLIAVSRARLLAVKILSGVLVLTLAMATGLVLVNDFYGYYRTWDDAAKDFGAAADNGLVASRIALSPGRSAATGVVERISMPGRTTGITREGLVYLPPQYFERDYRFVRFPVMELFHGSPGHPYDWIHAIHVNRIMDRLLASRQIGPMVLVIPSISQGNAIQECLDSPRAADDSYLSRDVPDLIRSQFRVSSDPDQWGLMGFSSGGYCAVNLALRHRAMFGVSVALDGYFRPQDGPAAGVLGKNPVLQAQNDPMAAAESLPGTASPLPGFWIMAGTSGQDGREATAFAAALSHVEDVPLTLVHGARHNFYSWQAAMAPALRWTWTALAPPGLRARFPLLAPSQRSAMPSPLTQASQQHRTGEIKTPFRKPAQVNPGRGTSNGRAASIARGTSIASS